MKLTDEEIMVLSRSLYWYWDKLTNTDEQMKELLEKMPLNRVLELVTGSGELNYEVNE